MISITIVAATGERMVKEVDDGTVLSGVVPSGQVGVVNDDLGDGSTTLREGDVVYLSHKSGKGAGAS